MAHEPGVFTASNEGIPGSVRSKKQTQGLCSGSETTHTMTGSQRDAVVLHSASLRSLHMKTAE